MTVVLYESPQRIRKTLEDIFTHFGDRRIAVARELTKFHEEVFRGTVSGAILHFSESARGEFTLVVEGRAEQEAVSREEAERGWVEELCTLLGEGGLGVREASERVAAKHGLKRRQVYQEALRIRDGEGR